MGKHGSDLYFSLYISFEFPELVTLLSVVLVKKDV